MEEPTGNKFFRNINLLKRKLLGYQFNYFSSRQGFGASTVSPYFAAGTTRIESRKKAAKERGRKD